MLGSGVSLPGDCKLDTGNIEKTVIKATYACPSGDLVVELAHPAAAPTDAARTDKFAVRIERGTPPPAFESVLLSRIRERESQFRWVVYPATTPRPEPTPRLVPFGAMAFALLVLAALLLWRRRVATRK